MTLEDKIVQTLKDDTLMKLVGDEDAIAELVKRAITEALHAPTIIPGTSWGRGPTQGPSLIMATAKEIAEKHCATIAQTIIDEMIAEGTETRRVIIQAIKDALPGAITSYWDYQLKNFAQALVINQHEAIRNMKFS